MVLVSSTYSFESFIIQTLSLKRTDKFLKKFHKSMLNTLKGIVVIK